ncbi:GIY-YIG nuclease family protein [Brevibacillus sp. NRS-1366]|uniref:GIY-YIG nuclease family protein n=1 Tax=Brevibacillus sp. NRS-1366 TaxID=3233899 RepID=UPI003D25D991
MAMTEEEFAKRIFGLAEEGLRAKKIRKIILDEIIQKKLTYVVFNVEMENFNNAFNELEGILRFIKKKQLSAACQNSFRKCIYKIKNTINDKVYIGSTNSCYDRWSAHKYHLNKGNHHCKELQDDWNNYGKHNFSFEVIEDLTDGCDKLFREKYWYEYFKKKTHCYNSANPQNNYNYYVKSLEQRVRELEALLA